MIFLEHRVISENKVIFMKRILNSRYILVRIETTQRTALSNGSSICYIGVLSRLAAACKCMPYFRIPREMENRVPRSYY